MVPVHHDRMRQPRGHGNLEAVWLSECDKTESKEMDIEGLAAEGNTVYVVGFHSSKRTKLKEIKP